VPSTAESDALDARSLFAGAIDDVWLEVGFGAGDHLADLAGVHPSQGFLGCEPFINGVASLLSRIAVDDLTNIRIFDNDARLLLPKLASASIGRVFLLFPDPWPKQRHWYRRFVAPQTLADLARILKDEAELCFASDHMDYVAWTLDLVTAHPAFVWSAAGPGDWRQRPSGWSETRYERKALARGHRCVYLRFRRRPRSAAAGDSPSPLSPCRGSLYKALES
jgi:tRNA (guanine-N7-)-methyltransferase